VAHTELLVKGVQRCRSLQSVALRSFLNHDPCSSIVPWSYWQCLR